MIDKAHVRRSMRGAYNQLKQASSKLNIQLMSDPDHLKGVDIGDIRDDVEAITQRFHEFSAYWNVLNTHHVDTPNVTEET